METFIKQDNLYFIRTRVFFNLWASCYGDYSTNIDGIEQVLTIEPLEKYKYIFKDFIDSYEKRFYHVNDILYEVEGGFYYITSDEDIGNREVFISNFLYMNVSKEIFSKLKILEI